MLPSIRERAPGTAGSGGSHEHSPAGTDRSHRGGAMRGLFRGPRRKAHDGTDGGSSSDADGARDNVSSIEMLLIGNLDTGNPDLKPDHVRVIEEACGTSALFEGLKNEVRAKLFATFHGPIRYKPNQPVFYQGHVGRNFFVIYNGSVEISVTGKNADGRDEQQVIRTMSTGESFGELALLRRAMRSANAYAGVNGCEVLLMDRRTFQLLLKSESYKRREARLELCNSVSVFKDSLSDYQMHVLVEAMRDCEFDPDQIIIEQGKPETSALHIVRKGEVNVKLRGAVAPIKTIRSGDYFGELSLLSLGEMKEDRETGRRSVVAAAPTANCVAASTGCKTIMLTREDFTRLLGPEALESLRLKSKQKGYVFDENSKEKNVASPTSRKTDSLPLIDSASLELRRKDRGLKISLADIILVKELGRGLLGSVHLALLRQTEKLVAIKAMKKKEVSSLHQVKHVNDELKCMRECTGPFIIKMISVFQDHKRLFVVLEYLPGSELFELLKNAGPLTGKEARFYAAETLMAISYVHRIHYAYRDLKPENILIDAQGHLKLIDFGFAKCLRPGEKTYTSCGTLDYMAPEVILVSGHDHMVDYYGLGVLIFELQTCFPPYGADTDDERMQRVLSAPMQFPSDFDATAKMTVKGLLDRSPARRLGCGVVGLHDIMRSPFFEHINFDKVETRSYKPPFVPTDLFEFDSLSEDLKKEGKRVVSDRTRAALEPTSDPEFPDF